MREIVIVVADLYLPAEEMSAARSAPLSREPGSGSGTTLPGLDRIARFGDVEQLTHGWRPWLAQWIGRGDVLEQATAASVAAIGARVGAGAGVGMSVGQAAGASVGQAVPWLATPLHLAAGLTTLHFDRRSILFLPRAQLAELALDFQRSFGDSDRQLLPLDSGDFLLFQPAIPPVLTTEPTMLARVDLAASLPKGVGAVALRRLGGEIEMWLHEHPVNRARAHRGELPVSTLWLWGGGEPAHEPTQAGRDPPTIMATGSDPYLRGLLRLCGGETQPLPEQSEAPFGYSRSRSSVTVVEVGRMLSTDSHWADVDALAELDRRFVAPAVQALLRREVERVSLVANDRRLLLTARDGLRFWRRPRPGLEALR